MICRPRLDGAGGARVVGVIDVEAAHLGVAEGGVDLLAGARDEGGEPVLVGDAGPGGRGAELQRRAGRLGQVLVGEGPLAPVEEGDDAFVDDIRLGGVGRQALALHRAVRRERHGNRAQIGHRVGHGEHVVGVDLDPAREGQARAIGIGQHHRLAGRERGALGQRPDSGRIGQARHVLADPAGVDEPGELVSLRAAAARQPARSSRSSGDSRRGRGRRGGRRAG